ncbi:MAG: L-threonylcarbamoyladenylate synthase [Candidatus Pacebacteria bacterium]|nr:L-threonylcarbamoyladenylate synthase [Candidatus Paceibacterota bacterium]
MKEIRLDENNPETIEAVAEKSREVLETGGVIVFPTDTIYGLGVNAFDENAISRIYKIKKRNQNKPISILVRDMEMAKRVACIDSRAEVILNRFWPGPVTVILRKKDKISYVLTADTENIAVRIPDSKFIKKLFEKIDFPITATSANISGEENSLSVSEIKEKFAEAGILPDLIIDAGALEDPTPSVIINLTDVSHPKLVRMGSVGKDKFEDFLRKFIG